VIVAETDVPSNERTFLRELALLFLKLGTMPSAARPLALP
jgi:hypothetical protein